MVVMATSQQKSRTIVAVVSFSTIGAGFFSGSWFDERSMISNSPMPVSVHVDDVATCHEVEQVLHRLAPLKLLVGPSRVDPARKKDRAPATLHLLLAEHHHVLPEFLADQIVWY